MKTDLPKNLKRVLVVDDEEAFTKMVKRNLERDLKYMVKCVNRSVETIRVAREFMPDIIFLDVVMPEADGGDIALQLRSDRKLKHIPIIFVSAMVSKRESPNGVYSSGGDLFLAKPTNTATLMQCIETHTASEG